MHFDRFEKLRPIFRHLEYMDERAISLLSRYSSFLHEFATSEEINGYELDTFDHDGHTEVATAFLHAYGEQYWPNDGSYGLKLNSHGDQ